MMEVSSQIKKYRTDMNLSQEELAEKIYVTRQTVSNWENGKNYPDIHSLLLLSTLFGISLDQLIKGDISKMEEKISQNDIRHFNHDSTIFTILLIIFIVSFVPLMVFFDKLGIGISILIYLASIFYAIKVEKNKKKYDIQTYKEIVAFTKGNRLDELDKVKESGKRPYQKILSAIVCGIIAFIICAGFLWLFKAY